jgi:hypothetical protein
VTFTVRPYEARTARWWFGRRDHIDFDPSYQRRGVVWDTARQAFLIDSMLNDFDIPKLYLADFTYFRSPLNEAGTDFAVVDGKQRLQAIFAFLADDLRLAPDFSLRENPELDLGGLAYSELRDGAPRVADKVDNFNLPVMTVISDDEAAVRELFVRLNSGRPLSAAELRNAQSGPVPAMVRSLADHAFFRDCASFADRAGAHQQAAAKLLLLAHEGGAVDTKRRQLDQLYGALGEGFDDDRPRSLDDAFDLTLDGLNAMTEVFVEKDPLLRTQGQLSVYFLLVLSIGPDPSIRPVLADFHRVRTSVERELRGGLPIGNDRNIAAYLEYSQQMRNPNDARSIEIRLDILRRVTDTPWRYGIDG